MIGQFDRIRPCEDGWSLSGTQVRVWRQRRQFQERKAWDGMERVQEMSVREHTAGLRALSYSLNVVTCGLDGSILGMELGSLVCGGRPEHTGFEAGNIVYSG